MNSTFTKYIYIPIVLFLYELIFALSTGTGIEAGTLGIVFLFAVSFGCLISAVTSLIPKRTVANIINVIFMVFCAVIFLLCYFVYCEFQVFYDINTVFNGAGGAATQFSYNIRLLLFSFDGLAHIFLYFLPIIIYIVMMIKSKGHQDKISGQAIIVLLLVALISFSFARMFVETDSNLKHAYSDEYNYESAIRHFGLVTATRLDFFGVSTNNSFESNSGFDLSNTTVPSASQLAEQSVQEEVSDKGESDDNVSENQTMETVSEDEVVIEDTTERGRNELDIDFEELATTTTGELANLDLYVATLTPSSKNEYTGLFEGKNLILITAEAFSEEAIDEQRTPTLYRMATQGIQFTDYYQPASAGTTGGEYAVLMGMLPSNGGGSMTTTARNLNYMTMGYQLNMHGYWGKAYHNNDYMYYSRHITHNTLGYSEGYEGYGNGMEEYVSPAWPQSDEEMIIGTLTEYIDHQPFNIYYMSVSGHSLYSRNCNAMSVKHWDQVADLPYSETVKAYLACQVELDRAMETLIESLEEYGIADDTVIVISADHFPYGLDSTTDPVNVPYLTELYGESVSNNLVRDHNRLIIWSGCLEDMEPIIVDTPTFSPDITPTLLNLFGVEFDSRLLPGRDVFSDALPLMYNLGYDWKTDLGTYIASRNQFIPANDDIIIPEGYVEEVKTIVRNKINFSRLCLNYDYYRHVFGDSVLSETEP